MRDLSTVLGDAFRALPEAGQSMVGLFQGEGLILVGITALITVVYLLLKHVILSDEINLFWVNTFDLLVKLGLALLLLQTITQPQGTARSILVSAPTEAATKVLSGVKPSDFIKLTLDTVTAIINGGSKEAEKPMACKIGDGSISLNPLDWIIDSTLDECKSKDDFTLFDHLKNIGPILIAVACGVLSILATGLLTVAFIVVNLKALASFEIGLGIGPILIGLSIMPYLSFLFNGWLKFMIVAGLELIVAAFMGKLVTKAIVDQIMPVMNGINQRVDADIYFSNAASIMVSVAVLAAIGAFLMWQVPAIAGGLMSGSSGSTTNKFGKGAVSRVAGNVLGSAGRAAKGFGKSNLK